MSVGAVNKQTGERIPTAGMPAVDSVLSGISTNPVQNRVVKAALDGKADTDMVAADFNAGTSYTAGNYCVQDGKLYKFKNNHSGAWSAADVDEVKITGELSALKSGLTGLIVIATETITTDSDGDGSLSINNLDGQVISASATGVIVTPWVHSGDYKWYVRVIGSNGQPFSGQASITYAYTQRNQ